MRRFRSALAASLLATPLLAGPARAESMPNLVPAHDVSGIYLITGQNGTKTITVEYSKAANTLRLNPQERAGYILYDFTSKDAKMVMPQMQRYMDRPEVASRAQLLQGKVGGDDVTIAQTGTETIAGHRCTDYTATDHTKGKSVTLCVTGDGVLLKLVSDKNTVVAQSLSYAPVPAADVVVPPGYTQFTMPQLPGAMGGMAMPGNAPP